ncbi:MAG: lipid-A-disaccharide synthase [Holosporales bacterium]|nr:lipid-A-disaccharide synthase [Holosporales bacterium]
MRPHKTLFIAAGEPSGDQLGASLIRELKTRHPDIYTFWGIGGRAMQAEGLTSLFPLEEIAIMGITDVLISLPFFFRRLSQVKRALKRHPPDILLTIDSLDFMTRLHKVGRQLNLPVVHWVAPSVWAWRPHRAKKLAQRIDHLMTLFPFEPPLFLPHGLESTYVGHPVSQDLTLRPLSLKKQRAFRARYGLRSSTPLLVVLLGSRRQEWKRHLPIFKEALDILAEKGPDLQILLPTLPCWEEELRKRTSSWPNNRAVVTTPEEKGLAFHAATAALAVSGTVTLELAYAGVPTVVAYKTDISSAFLARRLVHTPFIALPNILLQQSVMPEFLQERCRPFLLAQALSFMLVPDNNQETRENLKKILGALPAPQKTAADVLEAILDEKDNLP